MLVKRSGFNFSTLNQMKQKLKGASTGHSLLKRKSEALTLRFREITKRIDEVDNNYGVL